MTVSKSKIQYNYATLNKINELLWQNIEALLDEFDIDYKNYSERYVFSCPCHGGNNQGALNIRDGYWVCYTHHCEKIFQKSLIGFVRGILSHDKMKWSQEKDKKYSFEKTLEWIFKFLKIDPETLEVSNIVDAQFMSQTKVFAKTRQVNQNLLKREQVRQRLKFPAQPLIERGFSADILNKYDIGISTQKNKDWFNRIVVPIYDDNHKYMVACLGRSTEPKCTKCNLYHSGDCPSYSIKFEKWLNSTGFHRDSYLFNMWNALEEIEKTRKIIIVEGPLDVLKLEQNGIHNSVALFGNSITDGQTIILEKIPIEYAVLALDMDEAGKLGREQIKEKCERLFNIRYVDLPKKDVGECSHEEINEIKSFVEKL